MTPEGKQTEAKNIDEDAELYALEHLLATDDDDGGNEPSSKSTPAATPKSATPRLRDDSTFADAFSYDVPELPPASKIKQAAKAAQAEELDSSDDEEVKNFLERKYNEYGSDINKQLKQQRDAKHEAQVARDVEQLAREPAAATSTPNKALPTCHIKNPHNPLKRVSSTFLKAPAPEARNVATVQTGANTSNSATKPFNTLATSTTFTDPVFGLRIINPLISSAVLMERMSGRNAVPFSGVAFHTQRGDLSKDWVIAGVLLHKAPTKLSKKGDPFSIWSLSDLKGEIKRISLFLFRGAHKDLWKTQTGMCLAILNPSVFEKRAESGDAACLSIDTANKVLVLGQSKDMGVCKALKNNGQPCTAVVNLGDCDYCVYHMKKEFTKMSGRAELQSVNAGRGLNDLRNKVLGKNEVFYGGQSFSALPAKKSAKLTAKDSGRVMSLSEYSVSPNSGSINHASKPRVHPSEIPYAARGGPISKLACNVEASTKQRVKDLDRLKLLQAEAERAAERAIDTAVSSPARAKAPPSANSTPSAAEASTSRLQMPATPVPDKFKDRSFSFTSSPKLSGENFSLEVNIGNRQAQLAKLKAMQLLKKKPIQKIDPNSTRGSTEGKKRAIDDLNDRFDSASKRHKIDVDQKEIDRKTRIERIMAASSSHTNLIDMREQQEQDKYFNKLEKKEALEEKMLNTFKMACKAVICLRCKYTAFSAAERCKQEKHPLKVVDAEKRFFQCKDCGNRTTTVFKMPKTSCSNCKGSRWERAGMIRERKVCDGSEGLSLRGDEETFIGSCGGKANLNLLVPDE